jgi:hypothetical protein
MQRWKSLVLVVFSTFLFVGSIGMGVFHHSCHNDGSTTSFFFEQTDACGHEEQEEDACCSMDVNNKQHSEEDDCCDDEVSVYQVKLDYSHEYLAIPFIALPIQLNSFNVYSEIVLPKTSLQPITRPPPKKRRAILVENQTFLI